MMKKTICIVLLFFCIICLCSCGKSEEMAALEAENEDLRSQVEYYEEKLSSLEDDPTSLLDEYIDSNEYYDLIANYDRLQKEFNSFANDMLRLAEDIETSNWEYEEIIDSIRGIVDDYY